MAFLLSSKTKEWPRNSKNDDFFKVPFSRDEYVASMYVFFHPWNHPFPLVPGASTPTESRQSDSERGVGAMAREANGNLICDVLSSSLLLFHRCSLGSKDMQEHILSASLA